MQKHPQRRKNTKRAAVVLLGLGLVTAGGGAAFSYWTTPGSGTGSAATGTVSPVTIKATSAAVTGLYPGGPAQNISGSFDNPNAGKVYIHQVTVSISGVTATAGGTGSSACTAADFTLTQPANTNAEVGAGVAVGAWGPASIAMVDSTTDQGACKNATVQLAFTSN